MAGSSEPRGLYINQLAYQTFKLTSQQRGFECTGWQHVTDKTTEGKTDIYLTQRAALSKEKINTRSKVMGLYIDTQSDSQEQTRVFMHLATHTHTREDCRGNQVTFRELNKGSLNYV